MGVKIDIFNPQTSVLAAGLEGKTIFIYGQNNTGKTYTAARLSKPFFIACESGLNAQAGIKYNRVSNWADFKALVKQFTNKTTYEKARELYDTIVIDEVYASSIMCQDYVLSSYGNGALTLSDGDSKHNLYQVYEKEYFRVINLLLSRNYTVVFIGHQQADSKTGFITPKGDKRCLNPIIDNCDFVVYVKPNGVDEKGELIRSSGYFYQTNEFFARSRFECCVPMIKEFSAENLENAVKQAVIDTAKKDGVEVSTYEQQKEQNVIEQEDFDTIMKEIGDLGKKLIDSGNQEKLTEIIESNLGPNQKVSNCTKKQIMVVTVIRNEIRDMIEELEIE